MRLTKIKLVGFKTFVDPTTLAVPGNLVGIVGPNGCGKSNIIDAVTWVMGESSAKHLRGDNLTDVIFNGSGSRQAVGQASVELVFDNTEGKLAGQYGKYNEISIKRQMNREGISTYFLNGARCRRKDIQGIFQGTGLGPRSYAIIEQGVISRLIEAKPEELRSFIEEAAGISKFRERRRETENRMRHTRENIERLNDIREELGKQLGHLKRQARAAERYQVLKNEERQLKMEVLALNWQELNNTSRAKEDKVRLQETELEKCTAVIREIESAIEKQREQLSEANEGLNQAQSSYYEIGGDIAQFEQKIQHSKERISSLENDLSETADSISQSTAQLTHDREKLVDLAEEVQSLEPRLLGTRSERTRAYDALNHAEEAMQAWQNEWDQCLETAAEFHRQLDVDEARLVYLKDNIEEKSSRKDMLSKQLDEMDDPDIVEKQIAAGKDIETKESAIQESQLLATEIHARIQKLRSDSHTSTEKLAEKRSAIQKLEGRITSLESLQQHASGKDNHAVLEWLESVNLDKAATLAQQITVDPAWTLAIETVLSQRLQDICVDRIDNIVALQKTLGHAQIGFVSNVPLSHQEPARAYEGLSLLSDKVSSDIPIDSYLSGVYLASDIDSAMAIRTSLLAHESIVTEDGIWMGPDWVRINRPQDEQTGALGREQELKTLHESVSELKQSCAQLQLLLDHNRKDLTTAEEEYQTRQSALSTLQEEIAKSLSIQAGLESRIEQSIERRQLLSEELEDLEHQQIEDMEEMDVINIRLVRSRNDNDRLAGQREQLNRIREQHRQNLDSARSQWQSTHEQGHEIALKLESISSQRASLEQAIQRIDIQLSSLNARKEELLSAMRKTTEPLQGYETGLEQKLKERLKSENMLANARKSVQDIEDLIRSKDQERLNAENDSQKEREILESLRMQAQEIHVRIVTVVEQFREKDENADLQTVLEQLEEGAGQDLWNEKIESTERKINRLGPINLAAIDEFTQLSERKEYLDSQDADLAEALTTLENAIKKIDRETRTRFQETFDALNKNLKEMFPVLFGGGHAYLELTGNDLLDTGVTIMARPPGKRNSTVHLLSGGEKALTAVALVFSIFKLNPAPFCILDEVDAPLDDINTARYSKLVREMSRDVQFVFITHNKITMEIAQQLLGVTMQESGVSRLVSVDVDDAVEMAASA